MKLDPVLKLSQEEWSIPEALIALMQKINAEAGADLNDPAILIVGGPVRNAVLGLPVHDWDLATKLRPQQVMACLQAAGIKVVPTGIEHGTVTVVLEGCSFEITTLRRDVETDGRHADVEFTDAWEEDAKRRDFTMNTLLADAGGRVYDPIGCGIEDAKAGRLRFVGDPEIRIKEDHLRILRYFRFLAFYGQGEMDEKAMQACIANAGSLAQLSKERVTHELLRLLEAESPLWILEILNENNVLSGLFKANTEQKEMEKLIENESSLSVAQPLARLLFFVGRENLEQLQSALRLSKKQWVYLSRLKMALASRDKVSEASMREILYRYGRDVAQGWFLSLSGDQVQWQQLERMDVPVFPITGALLIEQGQVAGPELGKKLKAMEAEWIDAGLPASFPLD